MQVPATPKAVNPPKMAAATGIRSPQMAEAVHESGATDDRDPDHSE